ncbi:hypothetical protein U0355_02125 [Salimicrobium sp. PL1-032A]|uniref:hypothetical protein n=1 Tax=Salimicrobium sp. PL1-032A TaxID=3095364 RepID=UPI003260E11F
MVNNRNLKNGIPGIGFIAGAVGGYFLYRDTRLKKQESHRRLKRKRKKQERYEEGSHIYHSIEADKLQLKQEATRAARFENNL